MKNNIIIVDGNHIDLNKVYKISKVYIDDIKLASGEENISVYFLINFIGKENLKIQDLTVGCDFLIKGLNLQVIHTKNFKTGFLTVGLFQLI